MIGILTMIVFEQVMTLDLTQQLLKIQVEHEVGIVHLLLVQCLVFDDDLRQIKQMVLQISLLLHMFGQKFHDTQNFEVILEIEMLIDLLFIHDLNLGILW